MAAFNSSNIADDSRTAPKIDIKADEKKRRDSNGSGRMRLFVSRRRKFFIDVKQYSRSPRSLDPRILRSLITWILGSLDFIVCKWIIIHLVSSNDKLIDLNFLQFSLFYSKKFIDFKLHKLLNIYLFSCKLLILI